MVELTVSEDRGGKLNEGREYAELGEYGGRGRACTLLDIIGLY